MRGGTKYFWLVASVLALVLAAVLADGGAAGPDFATIERAAAPPPPEPRELEGAAQAQADAAVSLARPLFVPGRRPEGTADAEPGQAADPAIPRLTGIVVAPEGRRAIFSRLDAAAGGGTGGGTGGVAIGVQGHIGGFTVDAIEPGFVTLSGPGGAQRLQPRLAAGAPSAATPPGSGTLPPGPTLPLRQDPGRFTAPVGPLGVPIYSFSPAAPPPTPAQVLGFGRE